MQSHTEFDAVLGKRAARGFALSSHATHGRIGYSLWADSTKAALVDPQDIEEFPLLLTSADVRALIDAARRQGLSAAGLARRLIADYLRRNRDAVRATSQSAGITSP
jgi:hypothetical protein